MFFTFLTPSPNLQLFCGLLRLCRNVGEEAGSSYRHHISLEWAHAAVAAKSDYYQRKQCNL